MFRAHHSLSFKLEKIHHMKTTSILIIFTITLSILFTIEANGQREFMLGPVLGIGLTTQSYQGATYSRAGGKTGLKFSMPFNYNIVFAPEMTIAFKGYSEYDLNLFLPSDDSKLDLYYLNIDAPVKAFLNRIFFIEAGIQGGYLLKAKHTQTYVYYSDEAITITKDLKRFDIGATAGMGCEFKNGIGIALNIDPGFIAINNDKNAVFGRNFLGALEIYYLIKGYKK